MESIKILGKVTLKQVVDDEYKQKASKELQKCDCQSGRRTG